MKEYITPFRNMRHKIQEQQASSKQILQFKKDNMSSGREDFNDQDIQQTKTFLSAPQSAEKWQKDKCKSKVSSNDAQQTPYLSPFNSEKNQPELNSNSIQNKYVDIEFSSIEAERTIKKKVNGENQIYENKNYLNAQQNELNMAKLYREAATSQVERNNLVKTQFNNRKQYVLNSSFDQTQNIKKMNNFLNLDAPNMIKAAQKQKMQVKRERANQSLNGSPAGKRNHFGMTQNLSQQKNIQEQNNTININDIICQSNLKQQQPFTTTSQNTTINSEFQNNSIKTIQKLNENTYQKRRPSNTDAYEFPQIIQSNKSSQSQFDRILVSKPSMQGRATPKILQENLVNSNMNKSISNIASIKIRKKSTQIDGRQLSKQEENNSAAVRRETYSHHNSKESGNKTNQYYDETSDDHSFEGRYKQNQIFNVKQKIKLQKQNNYSGYKIFSEKEGALIKYSPSKNQNQSEIGNENTSPTYNVQTTTTNSQSNQSNRLLFNQYLQQQTVVSQISTNKTHTKLRLEEIKSAYQRQTPIQGNNLLQNQNKIQYTNRPETIQQNINNYTINQATDKNKFQNLKINTKQEDIILEDENDCTLTINEDDKKLKGSQITHFNSPEKIKLDQSFQVFQNKQFEEDLENWKDERESLKKYSSSIQEENSIKTNTYQRKNADSSIIMEESALQQNIQENFASQIYEKASNYVQKNNSNIEQKNQSKLNTQSQNEMYNSFMQNGSSSFSNTDTELKKNNDSKYQIPNCQPISLNQSSNKMKDNNNQIQDSAIKNISTKQNNEQEQQQNTDTNTSNNAIDSQSLIPQQTSQILQINNSDDLPNQFQKQNESISAYDKESSANSSFIVQSQSNYTNHKDIKPVNQEGQEKIKQSELDNNEKQKIFDQQINMLSKEKDYQSIQNEGNQSLKVIQQQDSKDIQSIKQDQNSFQLQNQAIIQGKDDFFSQLNYAQSNNLTDDDILSKLDFQTIILWEQQIAELSGCFKSQNATRCYNSIVNYCSQYLMLVRSRNFDNFATFFNDEKSRKIVRNQMNLEHLGIIVLLHNYLDRKTFMNNINNIRNIASYIHLNFILLIDLIISRVFQSHKQLMCLNEQDLNIKTFSQNNKQYPEQLISMLVLIKDIASQNIYRKKMNKIQDYLLAMKQNNEILLNLYRTATKHDKDFYNHVQNVSKIIEKSLSVEETVIQILNIFALYLTILENNIGFQPLPFLAVCPSPYLPPKQKLQKIENASKKKINNDENSSSNSSNIDNVIHENETTTIETQPKEDQINIQGQTQKQQDKSNLNNQNLNKQPIKQNQNTEKILNRTQRSLSKQLTKGQSNNSTNKRSATPNSYAQGHRNTFNQLDTDKKALSPSPQVFTTGNRRKSSQLATHSSTNIKYQKEEKSNTKQFEYTLVLDLDETLVHYSETNNGGQFVVRPFANQFLQVLSEYYEIVVFTAAMPDYANWVLDNLDPNKYVTYRLFRQHAVHIGNVFIKDLSRIGRPLEKTIIIDNVADNFQLQPENGIFIKGWFSDPNDTALVELLPLLKEIATKKVPDVRKALKSLKEQMIQNIQNGIQNPHLNLKLD
ncbi:NLI interacting factor-like phosphatase (macronuclear) [Tetrahymena thermophila SB210]|uniref:NLI interacting factor-like phosphatase n=1 Tax=Tetrahymena thermophila (strain SB210) TaxID=312017 RepID=Q23DN3_TETTS|nr:NLI interacting factor-like phosphatase [Tetrahymena thermophila SB210]EAR94530.3 NLI interacting factor-like phosphatase [Tetrahymena thermophila SB210]|eukprot:XP_001014653.3 NLI interacting factor-like phosphatase [Tetrahymena thermophila SB210]